MAAKGSKQSVASGGSSGMSVEELREAFKKLLPDTLRAGEKECASGDVIVPRSFYEDCRAFAQGSRETPPSAPQCPPQETPLRWDDNDNTDVAFIPPEDAQQLLHLAGGQVDLTLNNNSPKTDPNIHPTLVAPDGQEMFIVTPLCEGRGWDSDLGRWFLPSSATLGDAVTGATGRPPRLITDIDHDLEFSLKRKCLEWRKNCGGYLHVHF